MPLDTPQKIAHLQAVVNRSYTGRTKTVVFVAIASGNYTYTAVSGVIFRPQEVIDPTIPDLSGATNGKRTDMLMIAPLGTNFTGVVYIADTSTATAGGVAAAKKYEPIEINPAGIIPGGTHLEVPLRRLR